MLAPYENRELRAIAYKVIVEPEPEPERVIAIVKERDDAFRIGRILSIGDEAARKVPELRVGDRVLYAQSVSCTTAVRNRHIVHHDHVICAVEEGATLAELDPGARPGALAYQGAVPQ